jgi:hypothetical protein
MADELPGPDSAWGSGQRSGLLLVFVRRVRTQAPTPRPSLVSPDGMNQEGEPVEVGVLEPVSREAHYMLLLFALPAARTPPGRHAENPVPFLAAVGHVPASRFLASPVSLILSSA